MFELKAASEILDLSLGTCSRSNRQIPTTVEMKYIIKVKFKILLYLVEEKSLGRAKGKITVKLTIEAQKN